MQRSFKIFRPFLLAVAAGFLAGNSSLTPKFRVPTQVEAGIARKEQSKHGCASGYKTWRKKYVPQKPSH